MYFTNLMWCGVMVCCVVCVSHSTAGAVCSDVVCVSHSTAVAVCGAVVCVSHCTAVAVCGAAVCDSHTKAVACASLCEFPKTQLKLLVSDSHNVAKLCVNPVASVPHLFMHLISPYHRRALVTQRRAVPVWAPRASLMT